MFYNYMKGDCIWASQSLLSGKSDRTRGYGLKLHQGSFRLGNRKNSLTEMIIWYWKSLPRKMFESPSLGVFKKGVDVAPGPMIYWY